MTPNQMDLPLPDFFDAERAEEAKEAGIRRVADNNEEFLEHARIDAMLICARKGTVTADDLREVCLVRPLHYNAWGAVFRCKDFEPTGEVRQSKLVQGHGNLQRVWRLASQENR